jgi:O-succinylhomoserine sulfhydrylase
MIEKSTQKLATNMVHGGVKRSQFGETSEAIFLNSGYCYKNSQEAADRFAGEAEGYVYTRFGNPTIAMFEERMTMLEGAEAACATATGMAAVNAALLSQLQSGDHVLSARSLFSSSTYLMTELLPRFGIETTLVDGRNIEEWQAGIRPDTKVLFFETPTNPTMEIVDIAAVAQIAADAGAKTIIDNVFATPVLQRPIELGVDIVVHSATKFIDGQGRCMGGVVLGKEEFINEPFREFVRQTGASISPFNAWVMLKGLETMEMRVRQQSANASILADFLARREEVVRVYYPGRTDHPQFATAKKQMTAGGPMLSFELKGDRQKAFDFADALRLVLISNNLGDTKSLLSHPATTTHFRLQPEERAKLGITDTMLRMSVGIEDVEDLVADMKQAFDKSA